MTAEHRSDVTARSWARTIVAGPHGQRPMVRLDALQTLHGSDFDVVDTSGVVDG